MIGVGKAGRVDEILRKEELVVQRLSSDISEIRSFGSEMTLRSSFHFAIFSFIMDILNFANAQLPFLPLLVVSVVVRETNALA